MAHDPVKVKPSNVCGLAIYVIFDKKKPENITRKCHLTTKSTEIPSEALMFVFFFLEK